MTISMSVKPEGDLFVLTAEIILGALLAVWGIRRFSDSRWLTVGPSARGLTASRLTGIAVFFEWAQLKPSVSGYYLNGFWRLKPDHWKFLATAGICSTVPDAALRQVMKDTRVALHYDALLAAISSAMDTMVAFPLSVWNTLAELSGATGHALRTDCIRACHRSIAFGHYRVFELATRLPWTL